MNIGDLSLQGEENFGIQPDAGERDASSMLRSESSITIMGD
jgi:hypothetical protein